MATPDDPWRKERAQRKLRESQAKRRQKANGHGGARPGAGADPYDDSSLVRKSATTRLNAAERAKIEAWGKGRGLGFSEALREAALLTVGAGCQQPRAAQGGSDE
jgi:hypothetical protein